MNCKPNALPLLLIFAIFAFVAIADDGNVSSRDLTAKPSPVSVQSTSATSITPKSTSEKVSSTPSASSSTSSTFTTTSTTTTTTPTKTTTKAATPAVSTNTPAPITTTVKPAEKATISGNPQSPQRGEWVVIKDGKVQILFQSAVAVEIDYNGSDGKKYDVDIFVPRNATSGAGKPWDEQTQTIDLMWAFSENSTNENRVSVTFIKNSTASQYWIANVTASVEPHEKYFPKYSGNTSVPIVVITSGSVYVQVPLVNSFSCVSEVELPTKHTGAVDAKIEMKETRFQAFDSANTTLFRIAEECDEDRSTSMAFIVCVVLMIMIMAVASFYLISRYRVRGLGYTSM